MNRFFQASYLIIALALMISSHFIEYSNGVVLGLICVSISIQYGRKEDVD